MFGVYASMTALGSRSSSKNSILSAGSLRRELSSVAFNILILKRERFHVETQVDQNKKTSAFTGISQQPNTIPLNFSA
jgi:hypothetical protein